MPLLNLKKAEAPNSFSCYPTMGRTSGLQDSFRLTVGRWKIPGNYHERTRLELHDALSINDTNVQ